MTRWALGAIALLSSTTQGCTLAVLEVGAREPSALMLLPVAALGDLIGGALAGGGSSSNSSSSSASPGTLPPPPAPSYRYWSDPDDWVADCAGPLLCDPHETFVCEGGPGDCACHCEIPVEIAYLGR